MTEPIFEHEKLDECRLSIEYVAASNEIAKVLSRDVAGHLLKVENWTDPI
jgi:hypothetical protein